MATYYDNFLQIELPDPLSVGYQFTFNPDGTVTINLIGQPFPAVHCGEHFALKILGVAPPKLDTPSDDYKMNGYCVAGEKGVQCSVCGDWIPSRKSVKIKSRLYCTVNRCNEGVRP